MILVAGATGMVGGELVRRLLDAGQQVRVLVRDERKVAGLAGRVEVAVGDLDRPETLRRRYRLSMACSWSPLRPRRMSTCFRQPGRPG